ncbi:MAG: DUF1330 domain-containing protein [gamma proteobacterium symbiont of Taylorina sp.]|nr:DUF1330 domain-containing protein [gamma proteobacterium symbiont of Taylorina sp.]
MSFERIIGLNVIDDQEYQRYREAMLPILKTYDGAFGYDFKVSEVLLSKTEDDINRVFTIEFPSKQNMEEFFANPDYIEVQNRHLKNSINSKTVISMHEKDT